MPELTAAELKRLKAIESRIVKVSDDREALRAERKELKAQIVVLNRVAKSIDKETKARSAAVAKEQAELQERISGLVSVNKEQAKLLVRAERDAASITVAAERLKATSDEISARERAGAQANKELSRKVSKLETSTSRLTGQLETARVRLKSTGKPVAMAPAETAQLIEEFIGEFGSISEGLIVKDADVKLKVAFDSVDGTAGFVVPTVGSVIGESSELHEVHINLSRSVDAIDSEGTSAPS